VRPLAGRFLWALTSKGDRSPRRSLSPGFRRTWRQEAGKGARTPGTARGRVKVALIVPGPLEWQAVVDGRARYLSALADITVARST